MTAETLMALRSLRQSGRPNEPAQQGSGRIGSGHNARQNLTKTRADRVSLIQNPLETTYNVLGRGQFGRSHAVILRAKEVLVKAPRLGAVSEAESWHSRRECSNGCMCPGAGEDVASGNQPLVLGGSKRPRNAMHLSIASRRALCHCGKQYRVIGARRIGSHMGNQEDAALGKLEHAF